MRRIERQADELGREHLRDREAADAPTVSAEAFLQVYGYRVMDIRADPVAGHMRNEGGAAVRRHANRENVPDGRRPPVHVRQYQIRQILQLSAVDLRVTAARGVPVLQMRQLYAKRGC